MDFIEQFFDAMTAAGCQPAESGIVFGDDKRRRFRIAGDKSHQKNGSYQLKVEGDFAVGWFLNFREGKTHKFTSSLRKKNADYSHEERAQWKAKRDASMKENADRIAAEHAAAAAKAAAIWDKAATKGDSPYLTRKNASLNGARLYRGMVVIPVKVGGKLTSLQFISPDGNKRFVTGSELVGGYFSIAKKDDDLTHLILCEGFATGDAIRRATGAVVIVAFNAGNLKPVAAALRKKYPDARITIAADNDAWTTKPDKVTPWNPGIDYARQSAVAIGGGRVVWPEFQPEHLLEKPTDFNDALLLYGAEYVRDRIAAAREEVSSKTHGGGADDSSSKDDVQTSVPPATNPGEEPPHDAGEFGHIQPEPPIEAYHEALPSVRSLPANKNWRELLLTNEEGKLKAGSLRNAILFLKFHKDFSGIFVYNEFHQNIMVVRCPPWEREDKFEPKRVGDIAITNCAAELEKYGIALGTDKVFKAIQATAMDVKFHPAREYFNGLKWDGRPRLDTWLTYYMGCESENPAYLAFVGKKWMTAAVTRVYRPGCKFDHVLVIEGEQGLGKSTALRALATFGDEKEEAYFTDGINLSQLENKDTTMKLQGSIIIELAELSGFSKKEDDAIKAWIGFTFDDARLPYAREVTRFDRQFVFAATINKTDYLKDPTGNRRYWPVLAHSIDLKALKADREQLWAEAVYWYHEGLYIGPTSTEERMANVEREKRLSMDAWTDTVMRAVEEMLTSSALHQSKGFKVVDVMNEMGIALRDRDDRSQRRISDILQKCGMENRSIWNAKSKRTERFWVAKGTER